MKNKQGVEILIHPAATIPSHPELRGKHDCRHWRAAPQTDEEGNSEQVYRCIVCGDRWPKFEAPGVKTNLGTKLQGAA